MTELLLEDALTENPTDFNQRFFIGDVCDPLIELFYQHPKQVLLFHYPCQADEMWSFVGSKANKKWIWLAMNAVNRQIIGFHLGKRAKQDAQELWESIPVVFRQQAIFFTDKWDAYTKVIPQKQHIARDKKAGFTNYQERFNLTLRQRLSRLVRKNLAFSKKEANHIGAIRYFIYNYNKNIVYELGQKK